MNPALIFLLAAPLAAAGYIESPGGNNGFGWRADPPVHRDAELFPVVVNRKWGFIDPKGRLVIEARYDAVRPCVGGAAAVRVGNKWGVVGRNGRTVVAPAFDDAGIISDGMLAVRKGEYWSYLSTQQMAQAAGGDGKAPRLSFDLEPRGDFHGGFASVKVMRGPSGEKASLLVFITKDLTPWAPGRMEPATEFSDGAAAVRIYEDGAMRPGAVLLGPSGETLAEVGDAVMVKNFSEGLAPAHKSPGWGYIDKSGRWKIPPKFTNAEPFAEGLARIQSGPHWGFIDATGATVIPPRYNWAGDFSGGLAAVCVDERDERACGYVDKAGKTVIPLRYREAFVFASGTALVKVDDRQYKYIGKTGRDVWETAFDTLDVRRLRP